MKKQAKTYFTGELKSAIERIVAVLKENGCQAEETLDIHRVVMFRKAVPGWTEGRVITMMTEPKRQFISWAGPETEEITRLGLEEI